MVQKIYEITKLVKWIVVSDVPMLNVCRTMHSAVWPQSDILCSMEDVRLGFVMPTIHVCKSMSWNNIWIIILKGMLFLRPLGCFENTLSALKFGRRSELIEEGRYWCTCMCMIPRMEVTKSTLQTLWLEIKRFQHTFWTTFLNMLMMFKT